MTFDREEIFNFLRNIKLRNLISHVWYLILKTKINNISEKESFLEKLRLGSVYRLWHFSNVFIFINTNTVKYLIASDLNYYTLDDTLKFIFLIKNVFFFLVPRKHIFLTHDPKLGSGFYIISLYTKMGSTKTMKLWWCENQQCLRAPPPLSPIPLPSLSLPWARTRS